MSSEFVLDAQSRNDLGKGASRRLRRLENKVLGIVYGADKDPQPVSVSANEMQKMAKNEAFFTSLLTLNIDGNAEKVVIKDLQRHPAKDSFMHADFLRVDDNTRITMTVPLHFINEETSPGVKMQGGVVSHAMSSLEISCLANKLPEFIEVDMGHLNAGENIHISDLKLPEGVASVSLTHGADHDLLVAAINARRGRAAKAEGEQQEDEGAS